MVRLPSRSVDRRRLIRASTALGAGFLASRVAAAAGTAGKGTGAGPPGAKPLLFKISLAQWSLHKALFTKQVDNLDFAKIANGLGIDAVEYVNQFFKDKATDTKYLAEMKRRAAGEGVWSSLIMIDGEGKLGDPEAGQRKLAVDNHHKWVDASAYLGGHTIRVNAASEGSYDEQIKLAADGLRRLTEYGEKVGINVIVENHGGLSSNGQWLMAVIKLVDHPRCGTLPDFGNFHIKDGEDYDPYKGVEEMMPRALGVSAKSMDFDKKGEETTMDYLRLMKIVTAAGYHGYVGIEYSGSRLSEMDGIKATKALLERARTRLSA